jgi:acyl transferase domain-containing protein
MVYRRDSGLARAAVTVTGASGTNAHHISGLANSPMPAAPFRLRSGRRTVALIPSAMRPRHHRGLAAGDRTEEPSQPFSPRAHRWSAASCVAIGIRSTASAVF